MECWFRSKLQGRTQSLLLFTHAAVFWCYMLVCDSRSLISKRYSFSWGSLIKRFPQKLRTNRFIQSSLLKMDGCSVFFCLALMWMRKWTERGQEVMSARCTPWCKVVLVVHVHFHKLLQSSCLEFIARLDQLPSCRVNHVVCSCKLDDVLLVSAFFLPASIQVFSIQCFYLWKVFCIPCQDTRMWQCLEAVQVFSVRRVFMDRFSVLFTPFFLGKIHAVCLWVKSCSLCFSLYVKLLLKK